MSRPKFCLNSINTDDCPCKDCKTDRYPGCHGECSKYIMWNDDHQRKLNSRQKERNITDTYYTGAARRNKQLMQKGAKLGRNKKP